MLVLLDHPWPLEATLDAASPGFRVLERFENLVRTHRLQVVPFISQAEYESVWTRLDYRRHSRSSGLAALRRFASLLARSSNVTCTARPEPLPPNLSQEWRCSLREAAIATDWRNPQVIVAETRRAVWPNALEVEIKFDPCDDEPNLQPELRVLAALGSYQEHPFAKSDFDPWDLRHIHPPQPDAPAHMRNECCLPKPPLEHEDLNLLDEDLAKVRRLGWGSNGRYYFIPQADWSYEAVSKESWRKGRAFLYRKCQNSDRNGYVDCEGREWVWDQNERHWDVQTDPYLRVSNTGDRLD